MQKNRTLKDIRRVKSYPSKSSNSFMDKKQGAEFPTIVISGTEMQQYEISIYFAQKLFAEWLDNFCRKTNGSKRYRDLWKRSVDETRNELDLLSNQEQIDRQIDWLKKLRDIEGNDDGEHNETQK